MSYHYGHANNNHILGLGGSSHDFSAALMVGRDIRVAIEEERLTRRKHGAAWWYQNPVERSTQYCLESESISLKDIDMVVSSNLLPQRAVSAFEPDRIKLYPHHLCHAGSALLFAPPNARVGIIVCDGMGSVRKKEEYTTHRETISFYLFENGQLSCLGETTGVSFFETTDFPMGCSNSIGHLYELVTMSLGFGEFQEGKTMGLAAHGSPRFHSMLQDFIKLEDDMNGCLVSDPIKDDLALAVESILRQSNYSFAVRADMAASIQALLETVFYHCWKLLSPCRPEILAISGGCGLNSAANGRLAVQLPRGTQLQIPPFPGDAGLGLGAMWLWAHEHSGSSHNITFKKGPVSPRLAGSGRRYSCEDIVEAVQWGYPKVAIDAKIQGPKDIARLIASGKIIGIFQQGSEIGPRALGRRSLMADCRDASIREKINRELKQREPFRPLAPIVLRSRFHDFFTDMRQADEFMIKVAKVKPDNISQIPGVVHVDGTARVQVVDNSFDPFVTEIIEEFDRMTGVPMIINTSFNRRGEPIVETPRDAVDCFLGLGLDGLWLQDRYLFLVPE